MHRNLLLTLALVAVGLSGCTSNDAPDELVGLDATETGDEGMLHAMVYSDWGAPIEGATVSLLGTIFSAATGADGMAEFPNVPAGSYRLRIDMNKFLPDERDITIEADGMLHEEFVLFLKDDSSDARAHLHDYWAGATDVLLAEGTIRAEPEYRTDIFAWWPSEQTGYTMPLNGAHRMNNVQAGEDPDYLFRIPMAERTPDGSRPALIYPGASHVDVTVSWDNAQLTHARNMGVAYIPPGGQVSDVILLEGQPSGSTWTIPINPDQADMGHQAFSYWNFFVYNTNEFMSDPQGDDNEPQFSFDEAFHATVTVFKNASEVPYEPPHRDFWEGQTEKRIVLESVQNIDQFTVRDWRNSNTGHVFLDDGALIPPGTQRMAIQFTYVNGERNNNDGAGGGTKQTLSIRTADQNPFETPVGAYRLLDETDCDDSAPSWGTCQRYEFDLEKGWADSFYQTRSLWTFLSNPEGGESERRYNTGGGGTLDMELDIVLYGPDA